MIKKIKNFLLFKFDQIFYNIDFTRKIIAFFHYLYFSKYIKENKDDIFEYVKSLKEKYKKEQCKVSIYNMKVLIDYETLETELTEAINNI